MISTSPLRVTSAVQEAGRGTTRSYPKGLLPKKGHQPQESRFAADTQMEVRRDKRPLVHGKDR